MTPVAGTIVAERFRLTRPLGQGGMGSVWLAQHIGLDIPCAIKFIHASSVTEDVRLRFEREAKVAAQLRSPHVVQILDHGVWEGAPYIAMEFLEGEDLEARIRRIGRLGSRETLAITAQVARALGKAHAAGLVHRDLKPANIFLVRDDDREIAKVLDFGIAKDSTPRVSSTTRTGALLGTPAYMSPEQAQGTKNIDHRSDLWSLAVVVFECMTGKLPFESEAFGDLLLKIMVKPLPVPSQIAPVPLGFDTWWTRAASRDADARFQSAKELADALALALDISMADSFDVRSSITGTFRAGADRPSVELSAPRVSHVPAVATPLPSGAPAVLGDAATLVAAGASVAQAPSGASSNGAASEPDAAPALSAPRMRHQTQGAVVSVVSPAMKRPRRTMARVLVAAVVGALAAGFGGFFLMRTVLSQSQHPTAQAERVEPPPPAPQPSVEPSPPSEPPPSTDPPSSASSAPSAAVAAASSSRPVSASGAAHAPPSPPSTALLPAKPRPPATAGTARRRPKPTDFGI